MMLDTHTLYTYSLTTHELRSQTSEEWCTITTVQQFPASL